MTTPSVKVAPARRVPPAIPTMLDYPTTRQARVSIPSRIARDAQMRLAHLRLLLELASAGADEQWIICPSTHALAATLNCSRNPVLHGINELAAARYIEIKRHGRVRYVRIVTPGYALDWE